MPGKGSQTKKSKLKEPDDVKLPEKDVVLNQEDSFLRTLTQIVKPSKNKSESKDSDKI